MNSPEIEGFLDPYIKQLGINWKVSASFGNTDRPVIDSSKHAQMHEITFPLSYAGRMRVFRCDLVHELAHAKFSEKLDPIFASAYFHPKYDTTDPEFREKAYQTYYAQSLIDVWVSDEMAKVDKRLVLEDVNTWFESILNATDEVLANKRLEFILGFALNHADIARNKLKGSTQKENKTLLKIRSLLGREDAKIAQDLAKFYEELPKLPANKEKALRLLEEKVQQAAKILKFPLNPHLETLEKGVVWVLE